MAQAFGEGGIVGIDLQAHDVNGFSGPGDRYFHARHELQAQFARRLGRLRQAADFVMVGKREHVDAIAMGACDQFPGREHPVRDLRVAMQVDVQGVLHAHIVGRVQRGNSNGPRKSATNCATSAGRSW